MDYEKLPPVEEVKLPSKHLDYLTEVLGVREPVAKTYILTRKGYTSSAIKRRVGVSENTIKKYLDKLEKEFGKKATFTMNSMDEPILEPLPKTTNSDEQSEFQK